jgi:hypothetical protein
MRSMVEGAEAVVPFISPLHRLRRSPSPAKRGRIGWDSEGPHYVPDPLPLLR